MLRISKRMSLFLLLAFLALSGEAAGASPAVLEVQADNHVYAYEYRNWNNSNWGAYGSLGAGWHPLGGEKRTYLRFALPRVNAVSSAVLRLYHYHSAGTGTLDICVHRVTSPWQEGGGNYPSPAEPRPGDLTWENQPSFDSLPAVCFCPGGNPNKWMDVDITDLVNAWLRGTPNHGLVLVSRGPLSQNVPECQYGFRSREFPQKDQRPVLLLDQAPAKTLEPDSPSGKVLFFDDFSEGSSKWNAQGFQVRWKDEKIFWQDPQHRPLTSKTEIPLENVIIEYDAWCGEDGLPLRWQNARGEGYVVVPGSWRNTRSHAGSSRDPAQWKMGKHIRLQTWQHYRICRIEDSLKVYVDGSLIIDKVLAGRFVGKGTLNFYSYSEVALDNVKVSLP